MKNSTFKIKHDAVRSREQMVLDGTMWIFAFNCNYKSLKSLHRWHVIVFSLLLRIFDVVHKWAQLTTMCFQLGRSFRDDERADAPSRCSFIPTAETNLRLFHIQVCQDSGSVNSKPLPHLKGIWKDRTSLYAHQFFGISLFFVGFFGGFFSIKQMKVRCRFSLFYPDGANAVPAYFLQRWPCPRGDNTCFPSILNVSSSVFFIEHHEPSWGDNISFLSLRMIDIETVWQIASFD